MKKPLQPGTEGLYEEAHWGETRGGRRSKGWGTSMGAGRSGWLINTVRERGSTISCLLSQGSLGPGRAGSRPTSFGKM